VETNIDRATLEELRAGLRGAAYVPGDVLPPVDVPVLALNSVLFPHRLRNGVGGFVLSSSAQS
jgi:hypothetical protein